MEKKMSSKKANWAFLITIIGYIALLCAISFWVPSISESLFWSNFLCEIVVILPVLIFVIVSKEKLTDFLGFHKIKPGSVLMIVLFTFLSNPLIMLLNLFSQYWVDNEVAMMIENMNFAQLPVGMLFLSMAIIAPIFEEITCRGAFYHSYKKSGSVFKAMILSAIIFAVVHMNFNQAAYAFAMGIMAVLLVEATGSIWSSILYHALINGSQVILMSSTLKADPEIYSEAASMVTNDFLTFAVAIYLILTAVTLPLAWAVLVWLGGHEGRVGVLSDIWKKRKEKKDKMVTVPFVLALILCISVMTGAFDWLLAQIWTMIAFSF